jgi:hypothetical protein
VRNGGFVQLNSALTFLNDWPIVCWVMVIAGFANFVKVAFYTGIFILAFIGNGGLPPLR